MQINITASGCNGRYGVYHADSIGKIGGSPYTDGDSKYCDRWSKEDVIQFVQNQLGIADILSFNGELLTEPPLPPIEPPTEPPIEGKIDPKIIIITIIAFILLLRR